MNNPVKMISTYENNVVLIKPQYDASDKEIFRRNGMPGFADQMNHLVNAKSRGEAQENAFFPS
jgi:hypothetical protein